MVSAIQTAGMRITRAEFDLIFHKHDRRTLGQLLRCARELSIMIPETVDGLLADALEKRNYLNHDFFAAHSGHFMEESGRAVMIRRLREMTEFFDEADRQCGPISRPVLERMSVSDETVTRYAEKLVEEAKHDIVE